MFLKKNAFYGSDGGGGGEQQTNKKRTWPYMVIYGGGE